MGLFAPRTFPVIMKDMLSRLLSSTPLTDLNFGSVWTSMLEAAAQEDDEQYFQMFEIIRGYSLDTVSGADLENRALEYGLERRLAEPSSSFVTISDTSITKVVTSVYAGLAGPVAGSTSINANSATGFSASGGIIIGRGTTNAETVPYSSITTFPNYVRFNLSASTLKDHGTDETIILSQGGDRTVLSGTVVTVPASDITEEIQYTLDQNATVLDGESFEENVAITCTQDGAVGNVPIGAIQAFSSLPFSSATVRNSFRITNGVDDESDQELRDRIKSTVQSLSRGTGNSISNGVLGLISPEDNKRVVSVSLRDTTDPAEVVKLFIDDGTGFIPTFKHIGIESVVTLATGGEKFLYTANSPVMKAFVETSNEEPYNIASLQTLFVEVNGQSEVITFLNSDFKSPGAGTAQEVLIKINASAVEFEARVSSGGKKVKIFSRSNSKEEIRVTGGTANTALAFQSDLKQTIKLFLERDRKLTLLSKDGRTAAIESGVAATYDFSTLAHLSIVVDGKINNILKVWFDPLNYLSPSSLTIIDVINTILGQAPGVAAETSSSNTRFTLSSLTQRSLTSKIAILSDFTHAFNEEVGVDVNRTSEFKSGVNVVMFGANLDYVHLGHSSIPFDSVYVKLSTVASTSIVPLFQYWNGSSWATISANDSTGGFTQDGHILFQAPFDWEKTLVSGVNAYWFRIQRTAVVVSTSPIESRMRICGANERFQFSETEVVGSSFDYRLNRFMGQIELESPLLAGDIVTLGSESTRAFSTSSSGPYSGLVGTTLTVEVDGLNRTCTFTGLDFLNVLAATPTEVALAITARMLGVTAVTIDSGSRVKIYTNRHSNGSLDVQAGGANAILNFDTSFSSGFTSHHPNLESVAGPWVLPSSASLIVIIDDNFAATFTAPLFTQRVLTSAVSTTVFSDTSLATVFTTNNSISGHDCIAIDGPNAGQRRSILSYVAASGQITLASAFGTLPVAGQKIQILPTDADQAQRFLNNKQITLLSTKAEILASDAGRRLQLASLNTSEDASILVSGGTANAVLSIPSSSRGVDGYRHFAGLAQLVQWTVDGRVSDPVTYPGIRAAGVQIEVIEPVTIPITVSLEIVTQEGVSITSISSSIKSAVANHINRLAVSDDVILSNITVAVRGVSGVFDVTIAVPSENIAIADNELARIADDDIFVI